MVTALLWAVLAADPTALGDATALLEAGDPTATEAFRAVLAHAEDPVTRARAWLGLGKVAWRAQDASAALHALGQALDAAQADDAVTADVEVQLGIIAGVQRQPDRARALLTSAITRYRRVGDAKGEADALVRLGEIAGRQDDYDRAEQLLRDAITTYAGAPRGTASARVQLAMVAEARGQSDDALRELTDARALYLHAGYDTGVANVDLNLCSVWFRIGDPGQGLDACARAFDAFERLRLPSSKATALVSMAQILLDLDQRAYAASALADAIALFEQTGDTLGLANARALRANLWLMEAQYAWAEADLRAAISVYELLGADASNARAALADLLAARGALRTCGDLRATLRPIRLDGTATTAAPWLNALHRWTDVAPDAAFRRCSTQPWREAATVLDLALSGAGAADLSVAVLADGLTDLHVRAAELLARRDPDAAFRVLHALDARRLRLPRTTLPADILAELDVNAAVLWSGGQGNAATIALWRTWLATAHQDRIVTPTLRAVQDHLGAAALIAWTLVGDDLLIEHITARSYRLQRRVNGGAAAMAAVGRVRDAMQLAAAAFMPLDLPLDADLTAMHDLLLPDVALPEALMLAPDGALFDVPFAALRGEDGAWLGDDRLLTVLPTALWPALWPQSAGDGPTMVFGATADLPGGREEVGVVAAARAGARLFCDACAEPATSATFAREAPRAAQLHIVSHGVSMSDRWLAQRSAGSLSHLRFHGEPLWEHRILATPLQADLVVLAACDSAALDDTSQRDRLAHDHALGLARAFLGAGAGSVIAAQWPVDDLATVDLMRALYAELDRISADDPWRYARALQAARREIRPTHPDLSRWAGFTVVGKPGAEGR